MEFLLCDTLSSPKFGIFPGVTAPVGNKEKGWLGWDLGFEI